MPVTRIKSGWDSGNLVFKGVDGYYVRFGTTDNPLQVKVHARPTTAGSTIEVRSRPSSATATHYGVDSTTDWRETVASTITGGGIRAIQGVARIDAANTITGGSVTGVYGQVALNATATANGAGIMMNAIYGLIEDGGTYTAVSHLAVAWLDSHLTKTVSAGMTEFVYISNNGSTTFNQVFYIYPGNKITNLLRIDTSTGMVGANNAGDATFANWKTIKVNLDGTTHYLIAAQTIS